jgi:hypothetical protein
VPWFVTSTRAGVTPTGRRRRPTQDLRQCAIGKIAEIEQRIAGLTAIRATLTEIVNARCPIPFPTIGNVKGPDGDAAARTGPN